MTAFFRRVMGRKQDGRKAAMMKHQLTALAAANFRIGMLYDDRSVQMNAHVVSTFDLWLPSEPGQRMLWPSSLQLSLDYFGGLTKYAVPLDERAIAALAHSAVALDIYCWLAQRLHRIPEVRPQFVPWAGLHEQFGEGYARIRSFRAFFLGLLRQVRAAYPEARLDVDARGLRSVPLLRLSASGSCPWRSVRLVAPRNASARLLSRSVCGWWRLRLINSPLVAPQCAFGGVSGQRSVCHWWPKPLIKNHLYSCR